MSNDNNKKEDICFKKDNSIFLNYFVNLPIRKIYENYDIDFCKGGPSPIGKNGKTREEMLYTLQNKFLDYIFLIVSIIYFFIMHFFFSTLFVRSISEKEAYDKDTKEKSYSFVRILQVLLKNVEQNAIPTAIMIYIVSFIGFMYFKLNLLSSKELDKKTQIDNFPRTSTKNIIDNLNDKFQTAVNSTMGKSSSNMNLNVKEKDKTLYSFLLFFAYITIILYLSASLFLYVVKFVIRLQSLTSSFLFFINILILMLFIGIAFKILENKLDFIPRFFAPQQLRLLFLIAKNSIFYIPCLITDLIAKTTNSTNKTSRLVYIVLFIEIVLILMNTIIPVIDKWMSKHLGSTILNKPVYLNNDENYGLHKYKHGSLVLNTEKEIRYKTQSEDYGLYDQGKPSPDLKYQDLNILGHLDIFNLFDSKPGVKNDSIVLENEERSRFDHNYAMSFWYYINPLNENASSTYLDDALIINFANRPRIEYNHSENKLKLIMKSGPWKEIDAQGESRLTKTVIELNNIPLQKWNHLVINYTSGTLDIFMDGELVESREGIKPLMQESAIVSGQEGGINGRISNVAYYNKPLSKILIDFLYNANKNSDTPTGGGFLSNMYFLLNTETTVVESVRRPIADILAEILPKEISFNWLYKLIINLPETTSSYSWYIIDKYIYDYYEEDKKGILVDDNKKSMTGFEIDLEYRQKRIE